MKRTAFTGRLLAGGDRGIGATVYGTVLALAVLASGAVQHLGSRALAVEVATTASVIWTAHVYAHGLGLSIERGHRLRWSELSRIAARELPILAAAAAPTAVLVLGAIGVLREATDIWLAFGIGLAALAIQGARYARVEHLGPLGTAVLVAANLALGGTVVALKVIISH